MSYIVKKGKFVFPFPCGKVATLDTRHLDTIAACMDKLEEMPDVSYLALKSQFTVGYTLDWTANVPEWLEATVDYVDNGYIALVPESNVEEFRPALHLDKHMFCQVKVFTNGEVVVILREDNSEQEEECKTTQQDLELLAVGEVETLYPVD